MFRLLPPLDVIDPRAFMTATVAIFAAYPPEVWAVVVQGIPAKTSRPTLDVITAACEAAYTPIERALERQRARSQRLLDAPKRTPEEQARVDAQVEAVRKQFGIPARKARNEGDHA